MTLEQLDTLFPKLLRLSSQSNRQLLDYMYKATAEKIEMEQVMAQVSISPQIDTDLIHTGETVDVLIEYFEQIKESLRQLKQSNP